jgi:ethanolamine ammonia-lyase small subunit
MKDEELNPNPLAQLRKFTDARIAMGRVGTSIPIKQSLAFNLAHAHARDAVYSTLDTEALTDSLTLFNLPILHLQSEATNRNKYLKRPDLGRKINEKAKAILDEYKGATDVAFIIADGLSAEAVNENAFAVLNHLIPMLTVAKFTLAPFTLVEQGRVAIGDEIGHWLNAKLSIVFIGERPGLSSADSMGAYLTYKPRPGLTDESRNCVSNIRPQGLKYKPAAEKIFYLITEAFKRKLSGVELKDNSGLIGH